MHVVGEMIQIVKIKTDFTCPIAGAPHVRRVFVTWRCRLSLYRIKRCVIVHTASFTLPFSETYTADSETEKNRFANLSHVIHMRFACPREYVSIVPIFFVFLYISCLRVTGRTRK